MSIYLGIILCQILSRISFHSRFVEFDSARYAHEIGIIVFVSHYLSRGRATLAHECGPIIRRKPKDLSQDLGNDRDVRIADNVARKTCHEFFMLSFARKTLRRIRKFSNKPTKSWWRGYLMAIMFDIYLIVIYKRDD